MWVNDILRHMKPMRSSHMRLPGAGDLGSINIAGMERNSLQHDQSVARSMLTMVTGATHATISQRIGVEMAGNVYIIEYAELMA